MKKNQKSWKCDKRKIFQKITVTDFACGIIQNPWYSGHLHLHIYLLHEKLSELETRIALCMHFKKNLKNPQLVSKFWDSSKPQTAPVLLFERAG